MPTSLYSATDADLIVIAQNVINAMAAVPGNFASTAAVVAALDNLTQLFSTNVDEQATAQALAKSRTTLKNEARVDLEAAIRSVVNVAKAANIAQYLIDSLNVPVSSGKAPPTATYPAGRIDTGERLRHTISWTDNATPGNKRKPIGAMGAEIWLKLDGPPPVDEKQCTFLTLDSKTPYLSEYSGTDAGKMAHYMMRWRMADNSVTAWGETLSATITG